MQLLAWNIGINKISFELNKIVIDQKWKWDFIAIKKM